MSQLKTNSITNIGNTGDANIELYARRVIHQIRNLQNLAIQPRSDFATS